MAVGIRDIDVAVVSVDDTGRGHEPRGVGVVHVRRAKNEDRFYPIPILNLLLYAACIIPHHHNLQQNASFP